MIKIRNVSFQYKSADNKTLDNINLDIHSGECVVLIGESGCGKTSVTRLINGLIPEFYEGELKGEIQVANQDVNEIYVSDIARFVGSVFQDPRGQFFSTDTTSELAFYLENSGIETDEIVKRVEQTIIDLNLDRIKDRNIFELSGGEKQQIAVGSVYAYSPKIIVLDEPSANLDTSSIEKLREVLYILKQKGYTIVVAEHRIHYLMNIVDRAIYFENGQIKARYTHDELLNISDEVRRKKGLRILDHKYLHKNSEKHEFGNKLLEVRNVSFNYSDKTTLCKDINLSVREGEVIGITGHNGAGKSTLLKIICGLLKEKDGDILFHGEKIKYKKRVKEAYYVMQDSDYQLFSDSVMNEFSLGDIKEEKEDIIKVLEELGLKNSLDKHPLSLSGGQKQRLCVAIAKMKKAKVLCFDEPTSGLDYRNMLKVNELIKDIRKEKRAVIIVSHDKEFLYKTCSKILKLEEGRLKDVENNMHMI